MGVAHHSNYFRWLEEARLGFLRDGGWPYTEIEKCGIHMPVFECACRFVSAIRSEELIEVRLWVAVVTRARVEFDYEVSKTGSESVAASAATSHAYVDDCGRPARLDAGSGLWQWLARWKAA